MKAHVGGGSGKMSDESRIVRIETLLENIQAAIERMHKQQDNSDKKIEESFKTTHAQYYQIDNKIDTTIKWMVGIGVTSLISVFGAIINIALKLHS